METTTKEYTMALFPRSLTAAVAAAALAGAFALPASAQPAAPTAGPAATAPAARHQRPTLPSGTPNAPSA